MFFKNNLPNTTLATSGKFNDEDFRIELTFPPLGPKKDVFNVIFMDKNENPLIGGRCTFDKEIKGYRCYIFAFNIDINHAQYKELIKQASNIRTIDAE